MTRNRAFPRLSGERIARIVPSQNETYKNPYRGASAHAGQPFESRYCRLCLTLSRGSPPGRRVGVARIYVASRFEQWADRTAATVRPRSYQNCDAGQHLGFKFFFKKITIGSQHREKEGIHNDV